MNINIYQIDTSRDRKRICFFGLDDIKELTGEDTLNSGIYDKIFSGDVDCNNLEAVYRMFNTDHPAGYTGRSLSVSDVVEITDGDTKEFYFCDNIGFQKIDFDSSLCKDLTATEMLSVLLVQPGKAPRMVEIPDTLDAMQELVGGYIEEYMPFDDEVAIIVNEEGKLNGLPPNRAIYAEKTKTVIPSYAELKRIFMAAERAGKHLTAHITFTADSFQKDYSEQSRTYEVSSDNNDCYHRAFFYVMGISAETRLNIGRMFNFKEDCIEPEGMRGGWQTSGTVRVCQLAFNLWNGYSEDRRGDEYTPNDLFCCEYAPYFMEGIKVRYPEYCREFSAPKKQTEYAR